MSISARPLFQRSRILTATVAAAALLTTAACGGAESDSSDTSASTKLALAIQSAPSSFEVTRLDGGQAAYVWASLYDTLLYTDEQGRIQPNAAESYTYSEDRETLTFKIRSGMKFSSGAPVNAVAAKASLDAIRETPGPSQSYLASVKAVEAPDDLTLVLKLKAADDSLITYLAGSSSVIADPAAMKQPNAATDPVSSGPYILDKAATVSGSTYTLKKRKDYWNPDLYPFDTIQVRVMPDRAAVVNALRAGELNAGTVDSSQVEALKSAGLGLKQIKASTVATLFLADRAGSKLKPLGDLKVRQAINMAFDRAKLVQTVLRGSGLPTAQLFNPKGTAYDAALDERYPYDVAGAKKLLAEAGYADGFAVTMPSFVTTKPLEPLIAQSLADIGVKVTWESVPIQQQFTALGSAKYPMYFGIYGLDHDPLLVDTYTTPGTPTNPFKSADPELTELLGEADTVADPAGTYKKITRFFVEEAWFAPVMDIGTNWVTAKGVEYLGDGSSAAITVRSFGTSD
ncbi:peptide/nickel transport system substrate-binding protein [Actinocorallia herbida]|uniref:Peptide/nickel transport system substrate-binding protein n=1 Tax=Actinocorallia herbida TaxID=58109 RepID=A0A3N1D1D2_9ACTN|nr:ABC transporter substrate-binding protein [Actinocorallia herbida]ROO87334.1 peptide/nickel transport system substrate-binding protein [Actinocorallia herbida]